MTVDQPDQLSATFAALADPTRRAILARLLAGECSVTDLAEPFESAGQSCALARQRNDPPALFAQLALGRVVIALQSASTSPGQPTA